MTNQGQKESCALTSISSLTPGLRGVNVVFRVLDISEPKRIVSKRTGKVHLMAEAKVADSSASIVLSLWNWDIDDIELGKTYFVNDVYVQLRDESMHLTKSVRGSISPSDHDVPEVQDLPDMSRPFVWKKKRPTKKTGNGRTFHGTPGRAVKGYFTTREF
jgi:ssDNA-binding replication factor A large subunit